MRPFTKGLLGGILFFITTTIIFLFVMHSQGEPIERLKLSDPKVLMFIAEGAIGCGLLFGFLASIFSWLGKRNKERTETDRLMREYLEKKLKEEKDKDLS